MKKKVMVKKEILESIKLLGKDMKEVGWIQKNTPENVIKCLVDRQSDGFG